MRKQLSVLVPSLLLAAVMGCQCGPPIDEFPDNGGGGGGDAIDSGTNDVDAGVDAGLQFLQRAEAFRDGGMIFETVEYESGGFLIKGELCRPEDEAAHPVVIRNHDGWQGLGNESFDALCKQLAVNGVVVASSQFRGQGGSEGVVEFCNGEVDDTLRLLDIVRREPFARPDRVGMIGLGGHGGCVTLKAAIEAPALSAVVDVDGIGNLSEAHKFWGRMVEYDEPLPCPDAGVVPNPYCEGIHTSWSGAVETAIGGRPSGFPLSYQARSPGLELSLIQSPLLMLQAEDNIVTHYSQACLKRDELVAPTADGGTARPVTAWYLDGNQASAQPGYTCGGTFSSGIAPDPKIVGSLSDSSSYLFVFGREAYPYKSRAGDHARGLSLRFLLDRLNAP